MGEIRFRNYPFQLTLETELDTSFDCNKERNVFRLIATVCKNLKSEIKKR